MKNNFRCENCNQLVEINDQIGTHNRNHCPNCLWSKHVDNTPGDRASSCNSLMSPIGLTFKMARDKKYNSSEQGELMLIHKCNQCGKISLNRIAGDDDTQKIEELVNESPEIEGIKILNSTDLPEIKKQLFGT